MRGSAVCQIQSEAKGWYSLCLRARTITTEVYRSPASPAIRSVHAAPEREVQGALKTAAISRAAQKWTTVGVANAPIDRGPVGILCAASAIMVITTNWSPVSTAADEPTMT